jgi:hypothetical protein
LGNERVAEGRLDPPGEPFRRDLAQQGDACAGPCGISEQQA